MIVRVKLFLMRGRDQVREAFWRYEAQNVQLTKDFKSVPFLTRGLKVHVPRGFSGWIFSSLGLDITEIVEQYTSHEANGI